ncbi:hypothetical protein Trydic_g20035 [Trypoxylus dichotomus]
MLYTPLTVGRMSLQSYRDENEEGRRLLKNRHVRTVDVLLGRIYTEKAVAAGDAAGRGEGVTVDGHDI